ncbi:HD domain-containing protein [Mammaliicoccus lentus]|uniref:HD domain-containing protein n=1 Tax=Mammaliicoccus lentus TaxID=42858 RepID=UPI002646FD64|nr:HD domain-containing protein [Mammaliicoccus lentus]
MDKQWIIKEAERHVGSLHKEDTTGHDFEHIMRVRHLALEIAKHEKIDTFIVELASLLHDSVDRKLFKDANKAWDNLYVWMNKVQLSTEIKKEIIHILKYISYKGGKNKDKLNSLAGKVVQDADRIDALGAIGIARTFQFAGHFNEPMHITDLKPRDLNTITADQYHNEPNTAINHFYEKLLLLKDQMNTVRGKEIAEDRHKFMLMFLEQFFEEWNVGI